jgi:hypothetical protein
LIALSHRASKLVGILLQIAAGLIALGVGLLQWVVAGVRLALEGPYNGHGEWITPPHADARWHAYFASLHWAEAVGPLLAIAGLVWCSYALCRFLGRVT